MHFRIRRNVVQLVRTTYDPQTKKPRAKVVGRLPLSEPELPDELRAALSPEEAAETEAWINRECRKVLLREELAALSLVETLGLAESWFQRQGDTPAAVAMAAALLPNLSTLRRTLKRIVD